MHAYAAEANAVKTLAHNLDFINNSALRCRLQIVVQPLSKYSILSYIITETTLSTFH